jgi:hypothetical protein
MDNIGYLSTITKFLPQDLVIDALEADCQRPYRNRT